MNGPEARTIVVNDDPAQLRLITGLLEKRGLVVDGFVESEAALRNLSSELAVQLIILDLHMPGIDGWRFCRLLRSPEYARYNDVPILVISATFSGTDVEAVTADLGANAFLSSPFAADDFHTYVDDLLAGRRPRTPLKALVVDDDATLLDALGRSLEGHGYDVRTAPSLAGGRLAFDEVRPDLLVVDYHLGDGKGADLLDLVRKPGDATVALVMTGDGDPGLPLELMRRGADGYVRKPFEPAYLVDLAHASRRERSLLRIEEILEARTRELRASEERYRTLFRTIPYAVLILDERGVIRQSNEAARRELRRTEEELVGADLRDLVPASRLPDLMRDLSTIWQHGTGEVATAFDPVGGTVQESEASGRIIEYEGEQALLLVARDVTERNRLEAERRQLETKIQHRQKLESLGVLAGGIAHDFNNLLVGILGNASLAMMDLAPGEAAWESVKQIELAARRAAELTNQILAYSGNARVSLRDVDLSVLVSELGQLLEPAVSKKAVLRYDIAEDAPGVKGDPSQIRQVIMNLIMNASDALEGKQGIIGIRIGSVVADEPALQDTLLGDGLSPGAYALIEVTDTGVGMSPDTQRRMFDPFFTTKFSGRGLGLAATLGIVRSHGGTISVESSPGKGSTFRILLPAVGNTLGARPPSDPPSDRRWRGSGTLLVVDDEWVVRSVARASLERHGFRVLTACDGREGLARYREHANEIRVVLLDLSMPELDGEEVLSAILDLDPGARVILSSGYVDDEAASRLRSLGAREFLPKPYDPDELVELVRLVMSDGELPASLPASAGA